MRTPIVGRRPSRGRGPLLALLVGVTLSVGLLPLPLLGASAQGATVVTSFAKAALDAAQRSLAAGEGPSFLANAQCNANGPNAVSCAGAVPAASLVGWVNATTSGGPTARESAAMAYDAADGYVVLFGGCGASCKLSDTWTYSNGVWTNITASQLHAPSGRTASAMTYDAAQGDGYIVLFGGINSSGFQQDTWGFAAGQWTHIKTGTFGIPAARFGSSLAYDSTDGYVIMFGGGGFYQGRTLLNDTWEYSHGTWTRVQTVGPAPIGRLDAMLADDPGSGGVLLFGGQLTNGPGHDLWLFVGGQWTQVGGTALPSARAGAAMAYFPALGEVVLYGGLTRFGYASDTWVFHAGKWSLFNTGSGAFPSSRGFGDMVYDGSTKTIRFFGGWNLGRLYAETWEFTNNTSSPILRPAGASGASAFPGAPTILGLGLVPLGNLVAAASPAAGRRRPIRAPSSDAKDALGGSGPGRARPTGTEGPPDGAWRARGR